MAGSPARLLHGLKNGQRQRVGSQEAKQVNIRLIAATNRDLWVKAERDSFGEALCYRLLEGPLGSARLLQLTPNTLCSTLLKYGLLPGRGKE